MKLVNRIFQASVLMVLASVLNAQTDLGIARYSDSDQLLYPERTDRWIHMGSSLGSEYGDEPFNPSNPGAIGVVQMEPTAYQYFLDNHEYADGTMYLLSFYGSEAESDPQLPGFVQGALNAQEIPVIDSNRFSEGRGFFLFPADASTTTGSDKIPDGSACVECHMAEAEYNGTFSQFYPTIRGITGN